MKQISEAELDKLVSRYSELPIVATALQRLQLSLPPHLVYHSAKHTQNVLREALRFAATDGLPAREQELLAIAAAYHDIGFLERMSKNEIFGAQAARRAMSESAQYSNEDMALVERMILDTEIQAGPEGPYQMCSHRLSGYLLDADLSNLGREDFLHWNQLLQQELGVRKEELLAFSRKLMLNHDWHTPAAQSLRSAGKKKNLEALEQLLARD